MPEIIALLVFAGSLLSLTLMGDLVCYLIVVVPRPGMLRISRRLSRRAYGLAQILSLCCDCPLHFYRTAAS